MEQIESKIQQNTLYLMDKIKENSELVLLSNPASKLQSGIILFKHSTLDINKLYKHLQDNGVVCALRGGGIRFSPHFYHSKDELDHAMLIMDMSSLNN